MLRKTFVAAAEGESINIRKCFVYLCLYLIKQRMCVGDIYLRLQIQDVK